jgi:hypothetical protein
MINLNTPRCTHLDLIMQFYELLCTRTILGKMISEKVNIEDLF